MNPVQSAKPIEYDLFISHSSADALVTVHGRHFHLIEHLKEKLEAHTHPSERRNGRPRRFRVCTYEEDFELKGDVSTAIQDRIRASRFMLVICSKASADSQYVHSELDFFTKAREGAPPLAGLWNVPPHEAFPGIFPPDTIAANFAPLVITSFKHWLTQLENECHKVVAEVWRLPLTKVWDRFELDRRRRRWRTLFWAGIGVAMILVLAGFATHQNLSIRRQAAHAHAVAQLEGHGFDVADAADGRGVSLIFKPSGESEFADPFRDHATRGLREATNLTDVRAVRLHGAAVTDETIGTLVGLPPIEELWLQGVNVTDSSTPYIASLEHLKTLELDRTQVTKAGIAKLRSALPSVDIRHSSESFVDLSGWDFAPSVKAEPESVEPRTGRRLSEEEWVRVIDYARHHATQFGFPEKRDDSLLIGSFNVRRLGAKARRSRGAWLLLAKTLQPFDLIGIQEVMEDLEGIEFLQELLGPSYELIYSPLSGTSPGEPGLRERVVFLYNRQTVRRTDIAGTLHVGSGEVIDTILSHWTEFRAAVEPQLAKVREAEATGRRYRPRLKLPAALSFRRAPFMVSFELGGRNAEAPYRFLAVNCHLEFSQYMSSRWNEPELLMRLLAGESMDRRDSTMVNGNIVVMGDLNLDYNRPETDRPKVDALIGSIAARSANGAEHSLSVSFPFLETHPDETGVFRTNTRKNQTFDQIGLLAHDPRFPDPLAHRRAGFEKGGFDYGVFDFVGLIARALSTESMAAFSPVEAKNYERELLKKLDFDVSDHLPIWIRLPMPDASDEHVPLSPSAG